MPSWSFFLLFLIQSSYQQDCNEFSLGDCQDEGEGSLMWESDKVTLIYTPKKIFIKKFTLAGEF